jgi:hypothetical protein
VVTVFSRGWDWQVSATAGEFTADRLLEQPEMTECLLDYREFFRRTRIRRGFVSGRSEAEQLFAVCDPRAFGHEAVLAQNPLLDFLIGGALTDGLVLTGVIARRAPISSIIIAVIHFALACHELA